MVVTQLRCCSISIYKIPIMCISDLIICMSYSIVIKILSTFKLFIKRLHLSTLFVDHVKLTVFYISYVLKRTFYLDFSYKAQNLKYIKLAKK